MKISDDFYGSSFEVAQVGATLLSFNVRTNRGTLSTIDGFTSDEELEQGTGFRSWIMAPFSNRMRHNSYTFQGTTYSLGSPDDRTILNGLIAKEFFEVSALNILETAVEVELTCDSFVKKPLPGYPFQVIVIVKYRFEGNSLSVTISGKNVGDSPAPFSAGWHPYLKVSDKLIDTTILTIPAERLVLTDSTFIPFKGQMTYTPLSNLPGSDFRFVVYSKKRMLGRRILNVCYSHLVPSIDGMIISRLDNPEFNTALCLKQKSGVLQAYTGDDLPNRQRAAIAFQPAEQIADAFNREELAEAITLNPGDQKDFVVELEFIQN